MEVGSVNGASQERAPEQQGEKLRINSLVEIHFFQANSRDDARAIHSGEIIYTVGGVGYADAAVTLKDLKTGTVWQYPWKRVKSIRAEPSRIADPSRIVEG